MIKIRTNWIVYTQPWFIRTAIQPKAMTWGIVATIQTIIDSWHYHASINQIRSFLGAKIITLPLVIPWYFTKLFHKSFFRFSMPGIPGGCQFNLRCRKVRAPIRHTTPQKSTIPDARSCKCFIIQNVFNKGISFRQAFCGLAVG